MRHSLRKSFITAAILASFALIGGTGLTVSSAWLITMAAQHPPVLVLGVAIVLVRFFGIFRSLARYGERVISHEAILTRVTKIRAQLFTVMASRVRERAQDVGQQGKLLVDDVERAQEFHLRVSLPGVTALVSGITTVLLALWIEPNLTKWFLLSITIFSIVIPFLVRRLLDPIAFLIEESENELAQDISEASYAMIEAEVYGYANQYRLTLASRTSTIQALESKLLLRLSLIQGLALFGLGFSLIGSLLTLNGAENVLPIHISMVVFLALVGYEGYTTWFPNLYLSGKNRRAVQSIKSLAADRTSANAESLSPIGTKVVASELSPFWKEEFLRPLTFEVNPGEIILITGPSGVGKSTLAAAVMGFAPYKGSLTIGGVEVRALEDLSQLVTGTLQHGYVFNTSVRENLKIANPDATDVELIEVLKAVELSDFSLDQIIGEFGRTISGGEEKRLAIARALLSPAPILILDEPLEHLEHDLAERLQSAIIEKAGGRSLIVITHSPWLQYSRKVELARE